MINNMHKYTSIIASCSLNTHGPVKFKAVSKSF
jgi:hypothetical protein